MEHFEEQPIIEQKPFENPAVQSFFAKWCEINDSIQPKIINRGEWEQRGAKGILEKTPDGKQTLFIPEDLQLWEMVGVMEVVDHDTFAAKPEHQARAKKKLLELGKTFKNAGIYIAQRLGSIEQGRDIARLLAEEFYSYGQSLVSSEKSEKSQTIDRISSQSLTAEELDTVDRFLAGDNLYESRQARVEETAAGNPAEKDELYESERQKTLSQFFRASEKAFMLKKKSAGGQLSESKTALKPWQSNAPLHNTFLGKIEKAMKQKIETPKREFEMAIFRRGLAKLTSEMRETKEMKTDREASDPQWRRDLYSFFEIIGIDLRLTHKKIADILKINQLKAELETLRKSGDLEKISSKERGIADKIQKTVSRFPYQLNANNPAEIVANQYINCVGASMLGGALMKEAGLNYLVGDVPKHSILFLVTIDGRVEWRDMENPWFNEVLTNEIIEGRKKDGAPLTTEDIVAFSKKPTPGGLMFDVSEKYREKLSWVKEGQRLYVAVFEPEYGQQIQVLNNTGGTLDSLGRHEEAMEAYRQAVAINPKHAHSYYGLGNVFYSLGRHEEAVEAYRKFIDLADKKNDDYWIKEAERMIYKLKNLTP